MQLYSDDLEAVKNANDFNSNGRLLKVVEKITLDVFLKYGIKSIPEAKHMLCLIEASTNKIRASSMKNSEPQNAGESGGQ